MAEGEVVAKKGEVPPRPRPKPRPRPRPLRGLGAPVTVVAGVARSGTRPVPGDTRLEMEKTRDIRIMLLCIGRYVDCLDEVCLCV